MIHGNETRGQIKKYVRQKVKNVLQIAKNNLLFNILFSPVKRFFILGRIGLPKLNFQLG